MSDEQDDRVARNRAAPPRRTPGRGPVSEPTLRRLGILVAAITIAATVILLLLVVSAWRG